MVGNLFIFRVVFGLEDGWGGMFIRREVSLYKKIHKPGAELLAHRRICAFPTRSALFLYVSSGRSTPIALDHCYWARAIIIMILLSKFFFHYYYLGPIVYCVIEVPRPVPPRPGFRHRAPPKKKVCDGSDWRYLLETVAVSFDHYTVSPIGGRQCSLF